MRDAYEKFEAAGIKLYAISYDDQPALAEFANKQRIPFPLLSDVTSRVIGDYGLLNEQIEPGDALLYGIPYPGSYVTDENGVVVAKTGDSVAGGAEAPIVDCRPTDCSPSRH